MVQLPFRFAAPPLVAAAVFVCALATPCRAVDRRGIADEEAILARPPVDLTLEFSRIAPRQKPVAKAVLPDSMGVSHQSATVDVSDLELALAAASRPPDEAQQLVIAYRAKRREIRDYRPVLEWPPSRHGKPPSVAMPVGLPKEFDLYLRGALAFARDEFDAARDAWLALLELPSSERHWRSVWAAYMLGRCPPDTVGPGWTEGWYERARDLAAGGFSDNLGLAAASYGRQAAVRWRGGDVPGAIDLYLTQLASGDPRAAESLAAMAADRLAAAEPAADPAAGFVPDAFRSDARAIAVMAAYVASGGGPYRTAPDPAAVRRWLASLEPADDPRAIVDPILLARAAYAAGDYAAAAQWSSRAKRQTPDLHWVNARLATRAGDLPARRRLPHLAAHAFDAAHARWDRRSALDRDRSAPGLLPARQCAAELGVVRWRAAVRRRARGLHAAATWKGSSTCAAACSASTSSRSSSTAARSSSCRCARLGGPSLRTRGGSSAAASPDASCGSVGGKRPCPTLIPPSPGRSPVTSTP